MNSIAAVAAAATYCCLNTAASQQPAIGLTLVACLLLPAFVCQQVVRCFEDGDVIHVAGKVDPVDDIGAGCGWQPAHRHGCGAWACGSLHRLPVAW